MRCAGNVNLHTQIPGTLEFLKGNKPDKFKPVDEEEETVMIKIFQLKKISPREALKSIQEAGIITYMINWGCDIDDKNNRLVFHLKHGSGTGGSFDAELEKVVRDLEQFIKSIDV